MPASRGRAYKETTFQQLRSFCETARLGSFTAAAAALNIAHPTVWKQVHALERQFGTTLVEPFGRGCRLTEGGRVLAELASPSMVSVTALKQQFDEALARHQAQLTIAATPRIVVEDLPNCIASFSNRWPQVRLQFSELPDSEVAAAVDSGDADIGLTPERVTPQNARLSCDLCYTLEIVAVMPKNHPLARKARVKPTDLANYPLVNKLGAGQQSMVSLAVEKTLAAQRVPSRVSLDFAAAIRRYVELGFGIGILPRAGARPTKGRLHEHSMSRYFGQETIYMIRRRQASEPPKMTALIDLLKVQLGE
jgi:DNA-binding transcriptional LysR family regulator